MRIKAATPIGYGHSRLPALTAQLRPEQRIFRFDHRWGARLQPVVLLREPADVELAEQLRGDLTVRDWAVTVDVHASRAAYVTPDTLVISIVPHQHEPGLHHLEALSDAGMAPILVLDSGEQLPEWANRNGCRATVIRGHVGYERFFEDLYRAMVGPLPAWLDLRMRPRHLIAPTGVAWWNEDVYVADDKLDHVVRLGAIDSAVILPGLNEPHHIHLDRRTLIVSNKSADEVLVVRLTDGLADEVTPVTSAGSPLRRPHAAQLSTFAAAIADTDNNRVLVSWDREGERPREWKVATPESPLNAPCGLQLDADLLWIADTFNHRIVGIHRDRGEVVSFGEYGDGPMGFRFPVGVTTWRDMLFVADENGKRLHAYRWRTGHDEHLEIETITTLLAGPHVRQPFGLAVNREDRLAVADRQHKCVWLIALDGALALP